MEPLWIHIADELLEDLRTRLHQTRWPEQIPGIGWEQGTELDWLRRLVSYWAHEFDWRARAHKRNALHHFTWEGIHFVHVLIGMVLLSFMARHARRGNFTPRRQSLFEVGATFWHLVDLLWIVLFALLYLVK